MILCTIWAPLFSQATLTSWTDPRIRLSGLLTVPFNLGIQSNGKPSFLQFIRRMHELWSHLTKGQQTYPNNIFLLSLNFWRYFKRSTPVCGITARNQYLYMRYMWIPQNFVYPPNWTCFRHLYHLYITWRLIMS